MSVVNKMLKDLEHRQQTEASYSGDYQPSAHGKLRWWLLAGAALTAVVLAILFFSQGFKFGGWDQGAVVNNTAKHRSDILSGTVLSSPAAVKIEQPQGQAEPQQTQTQVSFAEQTSQLNSTQALAAQEPDPSASEESQTVADIDDTQGEQATFSRLAFQPEAEPQAPGAFEISNNKAPDPAQLFRQQAQTALRLGDDKQAIVALESLLLVEPDNHIARKKLAALLFANGQDGQARSLLQQGLQGDPSRVDIRQMLARLYMQQQQSEAAYKLLSEYPADALQDTDYVALRASLAQQLGKHSEARQDYQALVVAQQQNPQWWLGLAICEDKLGNTSQALLAYRKVIALQQISPAVSEFTSQRIASLSGVE
jgi:MSHA biogenesis protein MshN